LHIVPGLQFAAMMGPGVCVGKARIPQGPAPSGVGGIDR